MTIVDLCAMAHLAITLSKAIYNVWCELEREAQRKHKAQAKCLAIAKRKTKHSHKKK